MKHLILSLVILLSASSMVLAQETPSLEGPQVMMATIQFFCLPTEIIRQIIENNPGTKVEVIGNNGQYGSYELWTDSNSWSIIMHAPNGLSCRIDRGTNQLPFNIDDLKK